MVGHCGQSSNRSVNKIETKKNKQRISSATGKLSEFCARSNLSKIDFHSRNRNFWQDSNKSLLYEKGEDTEILTVLVIRNFFIRKATARSQITLSPAPNLTKTFISSPPPRLASLSRCRTLDCAILRHVFALARPSFRPQAR